MYCIKNLTDKLYWVGAVDRKLSLFENVYPVPKGMAYNSYLLLDKKTVLLDTVDKAVSDQFIDNIKYLLGPRALDYVIVNHMEPDHCSVIGRLVNIWPDIKIICNAKTSAMIKQFFNFDVDERAVIVKEGDSFSAGEHEFTFAMAPMVHWPEVMVTYDKTAKILFSADAFGTFGAIDGNIFADETDFDINEARRYYSNIVGKYGASVQALLKKAAVLDIKMICPLHGPVWRDNIGEFISKYQSWSSYTPEEKAVVIAYGSIHGNTENAANIIAMKLSDKGIKNIKVFDVSQTHHSYIISEIFRASHLILASATYNSEVFVNMDNLIRELIAHNFQNRSVAIIENGSWAPTSGKIMRELLSKCKNLSIFNESISIRSSLKEDQLPLIDTLTNAVADSLKGVVKL